MDLGLRGMVVLVTGASRGLGKAVAEELAREGCKVALMARDPAKLAPAVDALRAEGLEAMGVTGD
jgi:3-oxoacyl-[acyl-carrier protein] reductase